MSEKCGCDKFICRVCHHRYDPETNETDLHREMSDECRYVMELQRVDYLLPYKMDGTDFAPNTPKKNLQEYYASSLGDPLKRSQSNYEAIRKLFYWSNTPAHDEKVDSGLKFSSAIEELMKMTSKKRCEIL